MPTKLGSTLLFTALGLVTLNALAHDHEAHVVPEAERKLAATLEASGPTANKGIESINKLGSVDLSREFPGIGQRELRARELTIAPGGVVAVHQHEQRPGLAYILEGEITEHRSDQTAPVLRKAGDVAFENSGITHWWENTSNAVVRALVVDIILSP